MLIFVGTWRLFLDEMGLSILQYSCLTKLPHPVSKILWSNQWKECKQIKLSHSFKHQLKYLDFSFRTCLKLIHIFANWYLPPKSFSKKTASFEQKMDAFYGFR